MKCLIALVVGFLASGCVDAKVPPYTLTAPTPVVTPPPIPPVPPVLAPLQVDLSVGPSSPFINRQAAFVAAVRGLLGPGSYAWDFGDGSTATTTDTIALHVYRRTGIVTASVRVTEESGRTADAVLPVTIRDEPDPPPGPPAPPPAPPPSLGLALTCSHTALLVACNISATFNGQPVTSQLTRVDWDWGDGTSEAPPAANPAQPYRSHPFVQAGSYTVFVRAFWTTYTATATRALVIP